MNAAVLIGASLFSRVFGGFGGDRVVEALLSDRPGNPIGLLMLVIPAMFLMGFMHDYRKIVFIGVPIVASLLLQLETRPGVAVRPMRLDGWT